MRIGDQIHTSGKKTTPLKQKGNSFKKQIETISAVNYSSSKGQIIASKVTDKQTYYLLKTDANSYPKWEEKDKLLAAYKNIIEKYERQQKTFITSSQQQQQQQLQLNDQFNANPNSDESDEDKNKLNIKRKLFIGGKAPIGNITNKKPCDETTKEGYNLNQKQSFMKKRYQQGHMNQQDQQISDDIIQNNEFQTISSFSFQKNNQANHNNQFEQTQNECIETYQINTNDISDISSMNFQDNQNSLFKESNSYQSKVNINPKNINKINEKQEQKNNQMNLKLLSLKEISNKINEIENIRYFNSSESEEQYKINLNNKNNQKNVNQFNNSYPNQLNKKSQNLSPISSGLKREELTQIRQQSISLNKFNKTGNSIENISKDFEQNKETQQTIVDENFQDEHKNQEIQQFLKEMIYPESNLNLTKNKSSSSDDEEQELIRISQMFKKIDGSQINKNYISQEILASQNQTTQNQDNLVISLNKNDITTEENQNNNKMIDENEEKIDHKQQNQDAGVYLQNRFDFNEQKLSNNITNSLQKSKSLGNPEQLDTIKIEKNNFLSQPNPIEVEQLSKKIYTICDNQMKKVQQHQNIEQFQNISVETNSIQNIKNIEKIINNHIEINTKQFQNNNESQLYFQQKEVDNQNKLDQLSNQKTGCLEQQNNNKDDNTNSTIKNNDMLVNQQESKFNQNNEQNHSSTINNCLYTENNQDLQQDLSIPDQGHFIYGDKAKRITQCKPKQSEIEMEIEWEVRPNGRIPEKSLINSIIVRKYDHNLLLDFYESKIKFTYKNAEKKSQQVQSLNSSVKHEYNSLIQE